jgi:hypothetical protein
MGRNSDFKPGLDLAAHRDLGDRLRGIRADVVEVREVVKTGLGSATSAYEGLSRLLKAVAAVEHALGHEAVEAYGDDMPQAELQALYGEEGR